MKSQLASVAFSAGLALAVAGCATGAGGPSEQGQDTQPNDQQRHLATASLALESAYDVQYVKGRVDPDALQPMIYDVLQAMPEQSRSDAQKHIYDVISSGQKDSQDLTPEQRAQNAAPVSADKLGAQQVEQIGAWGWGPFIGGVGFGGLGFGGVGFGAAGFGWGTTTAFAATTGFGLGGWGWGWGGLGAFGFPACGAFGWGW